jgi:hypothetical protein
MGTNIKPTDTEVRSVDFEFVQDEFKIVITTADDNTNVIRVELTDDEFAKLDQVVFRERMNRFVGLGSNKPVVKRSYMPDEENPFRMPQRDEPPIWFGYEGGE